MYIENLIDNVINVMTLQKSRKHNNKYDCSRNKRLEIKFV